MPRTQSPLEHYNALLQTLITARVIPLNQRAIKRRRAAEIFNRAQTVLATLDISWSEATKEYRYALECHANHRHDILFVPTVGSHRNRNDNGTIAEEPCERCATIRLRPHLDDRPWFERSGGDDYDHSTAYEIKGNRKKASQEDYRYLFAAIQMTEILALSVEALPG